MNTDDFIARQHELFAASYAQFQAFGGPCVYFHQECLRAATEEFLSHRHIETLYATLTAWGMHRMGGGKAKTKLTEWPRFHDSIKANAARLEPFRRYSMLEMSEDEYVQAVEELRSVYESLTLTESDATVVVNSKALHHLLSNLIPPIDRQYTIRFLTQKRDSWRNSRGGFRTIVLPKGMERQFRLFQATCGHLKQLTDKVSSELFAEQHRLHGVSAPKALDNAIVTYVRAVAPAEPEYLESA